MSIIVVATEGEDRYSNTLKDLPFLKEKHSCGRDVFAFKESFAYFNYSYAASIHKAQGSTINHVFIIEDDILEVKLTTTKEKLQSINVGISRASYRAYIYNKIYKVDNSNRITKWMYQRG
jgi:ATP-dependent exoDNAse (exonuclease V) alpha subunit